MILKSMEEGMYSRIEAEYMPNLNDDDLMREIKEDLFRLSEVERKLLILYCEEGSYAGLARKLHSSEPTAKKRVQEIIYKLK